MGESEQSDITLLLRRWKQGEQGAVDEVASLLYGELVAIARRQFRSERASHTLQTTALVHEAWVRLAGMDVPVEDRVHFLSLAARSMRRILVDHARKKRSAKRGGATPHVSLEEALVVSPEPSADLVELNDALERLAEEDPRKARAIELHFFGGLSYEEIAVAMSLSPATVDRDLRMARAWLRLQLGDERAE